MCGICGTAGIIDPDLLDRMVKILHHRGPDDHGTWISAEARVALGNCRLSIIDLSPAGHMPMSNEDGSIWITQNGEIYNFLELRQQLEQHGHRFRSRSDTEVLIHGYEEWGLDLLPRLNGMFAFALLDLREARSGSAPKLLLARDRFGIKPLYYWSRGERLLFASEIKAILLASEAQAELDPEALHRYLTFLWVPGPTTFFRGIRQLPPGHYLCWNDQVPEIKPYWDLRFQVDESMQEEEAVEELKSILQRAVDRHLISDVPVGVFLSGGLDSSSLLALSTNSGTSGRKAYTVAYRAEDAELEQSGDDAKYARQVAKQFQADYHEIEVAPDIVDLLPRVVWHLDSPVADPAAISTYLICKAAQTDLKVLLSGQGADEVFAGYRVHMAQRISEHVRRVPEFLRHRPPAAMLSVIFALRNYLPGVRSGLVMAAHRLIQKILDSAALSPEDGYILSRCYSTQRDLRQLYSVGLRDELKASDAWKEYRGYFRAVEDEDFLNRLLYVDAKTFLPDLNLAYCDKLSSAVSVEVRVPYLDNELIKFLGRVPPNLKLRRFTGKHILRRAMAGVLPNEVLRRRKAAFGAPIRKWLRHDLHGMVDDLLSEEAVRRRGLFDPHAVRKLVNDDREGLQDNSYRIWSLLTLEAWYRDFVDERLSSFTPGATREQAVVRANGMRELPVTA